MQQSTLSFFVKKAPEASNKMDEENIEKNTYRPWIEK